MKKYISLLLCIVCLFLSLSVDVSALDDGAFAPYIVDFTVITEPDDDVVESVETRATGLILSYSLHLTKTGTTLNISGLTNASTSVVKCGFKDLTIQRRKTSAYDWEDYYEYGNIYVDSTYANLSTTLVVASGYQYRISCKHYAKKSLLVTQSISNTSGIVTVS